MNNIPERILNVLELEKYGGKLLDFSVGDSDFEKPYFTPQNSIIPIRVKKKAALRKITLTIDFNGTEQERVENIEKFKDDILEGIELLLPDNFVYTVLYDSAADPKRKSPWISQVKFNLSGIRHRNVVVLEFDKDGIINLDANYETPAVITIETSESEFTVNNITVRNIKDIVVIDGVNKMITENGKNKFLDCTITKFPELLPGINKITLKGTGKVTYKFYPVLV